MQPFFAVIFALLLLSESLSGLEIVGGLLIFAGIAHRARLADTARSGSRRGLGFG